MRLLLFRLTLLAVAALAALPASAALAADVPSNKTLYDDGPAGRYLVDGTWLFRQDAADQGVKQRWQRSTSATGWSAVKVPHAWNLGDDSNESMAGSIGWYRKDFELPSKSAALDWAVRFESVNYRTKAWLNGRPIGDNTGAYIPFELALQGARRKGVNHLVVRVDSRRRPTDFPPSGLDTRGVPTGGWWNYGGILREVYLQRIDTAQFKTVRVLPKLACGTCAADVRVEVDLRNVTSQGRQLSVSARYGARRISLGTKGVGAGGVAGFSKTLRIAKPKLWSPARPYLYPVSIEVRSGSRVVARYGLHSGVRSVKVAGGRLFLNGKPLNVRGFGFHEDSKAQGFAVDDAFRRWLIGQARQAGGTMMRTHYPVHPYLEELADREGVLLWSEIPVYAVKTQYLKQQLVRQLAAKELQKNIDTNINHPSVIVWSIANELSSKPGPVQASYIKAAAGLAHELDPTRPVGLAVAGYPGAGCQPEYKPLDVIGVNVYFGWYPGPSGSLFDRSRLSAYLDSVRACYPDKALMITEFGAEANRDGPADEKGTWAFQQDYVNFNLGVFATKPWLSGALYWALNEFRVRPGWEGGNPWSTPPIHQKAVITYDGQRKPAFGDVQRWFSQTKQVGDWAPGVR